MNDLDKRRVALARSEAQQLFRDLGRTSGRQITHRLAQFKRVGWQLVWAVEAFVALAPQYPSFQDFIDAALQVYDSNAWMYRVCQTGCQSNTSALHVLLNVTPSHFWCPGGYRLDPSRDRNSRAFAHLFEMLDTAFFVQSDQIMAIFAQANAVYHRILGDILRRRIRSAMAAELPRAHRDWVTALGTNRFGNITPHGKSMFTEFGIKLGLDADLWTPVDPKNCVQFSSSNTQWSGESMWRDQVATSSRAITLVTSFFYDFSPSDDAKFAFDDECHQLASQHGICLMDYCADVPALDRRLKNTYTTSTRPWSDPNNQWYERFAFIKKYTRKYDYERMLAVATEAAEQLGSVIGAQYPYVHVFLSELASS